MNFSSKTFKKYLPLFIILLCSGSFAKNEIHLQKEFQKVKVITTQKSKVNLNEVKAPIIIINFWASWCRPCIAEFKSLNKLIDDLGKKNIFVLGINNDEEKPLKAIKRIEKKYGLKFESVLEEKVSFADKFLVSKIPTSIIFVNKKLYKFIPQKFDFMKESFLKELKRKAKLLD